MRVYQQSINNASAVSDLSIDLNPNVFFLFVSPTYTEKQETISAIRAKYPKALLFGCSTSGEILGNNVTDDTVALTAVEFEKTETKLAEIDIKDCNGDSSLAGMKLSQSLNGENLKHVFVLSDGLNVNGAELVLGLNKTIQEGVSITGGLAGDGPNFNETFTIANENISSNKIVGLGLYSNALNVQFASKAGWDSFGVERVVTKSDKNVLYELDGQPALELYKSFLGDKAKDLPGSGLLFPLSMRNEEDTEPVIRTILAIDEENQSLTFAGNIPEKSYVRLMKANIDRLIDGAEESAIITDKQSDIQSELAILISCVGRRLVMKQLVEEEVEAVNGVLGDQSRSTGFYSYGELAPFDTFKACTLHNQTMTITTLSE